MKSSLLTASMLTLAATLTTASLAHAQTGSSNWQGPYLSLSTGFVATRGDGERLSFDSDLDGKYGDMVKTAGGDDAFSPGFCNGAALGKTPADGCQEDTNHGGIGLRGGYDLQHGSFVYGLAGEISTLEISDSVTGFSTTPAAYRFTRKLDTLMAIRARAGYAYADWLFYATGGYAYAKIDRQLSTTNALNSFTATDGDDGDGYQVGFGVEQRMSPRWSVGLEYLHTSLKDEAPTVHAGPSENTFASNAFLTGNPMGTDIRRDKDDFEFESVLLTVNYRFGGM
ncbi:MAG: outer membrane beta-barrel protein [Asticcacaulis sp.]